VRSGTERRWLPCGLAVRGALQGRAMGRPGGRAAARSRLVGLWTGARSRASGCGSIRASQPDATVWHDRRLSRRAAR